MKIPPLTFTSRVPHCQHSDFFDWEKDAYIKSYTMNDYSVGYHTHSFYELNIVLDGEGYYYVEEMSNIAKRGCVFMIPPYIKHGYLNQSNLNVYHMLIHRDFIENCFDEFQKTEGFSMLFETEPYIRAHYDENIFMVLTDSELEQVGRDAEMMEKCKTVQHSNIFINAVAKRLLCYLCLLMVEKCGVENNTLKSRKQLINIADCLNYIHRNFDEKLTVEAFSKRLKMSRSTFIRQFMKVCGCTPHQYINDYRLKKALEYIESDNMTMTEVAQKCGFYDDSHLRKALENLKKP